MSLTSEVNDSKSPVGAFFRTRFPNTRAMVTECNKSLRNAETIHPIERIDNHFGTLGTAIDYRLRYYFAALPSQELAAWSGAKKVSDKMIWDRAVNWEIAEDLTLAPKSHYDQIINWSSLSLPWSSFSLPQELILEFFQNLEAMLEDVQPAGRKLNRDDESLLNRYCVVLALFEQCFRAIPRPESPLFTAYASSADDLLQIAPAHWIDDLCAMSGLFYDRMGGRFTEDAILNPTFEGSTYIVGGADADVILDSCLIDFKTTINAKIEGRALYQLLGYCLLDFSNQYGIQRVGFYLPRQGRFLTWQLGDFAARLQGSNHIPMQKLQLEFKDAIGSPLTLDDYDILYDL